MIDQMPALIRPVGAEPVRAYVNWGRWVADCGNPFCHNALELEYGAGYRCAGPESCGWTFDVVWPDMQSARTIVALLMHRPDRRTRNWTHRESLTDLAFENLAHGINHATTPELGAAVSQLVLDVSGDDTRVLLLDDPVTIEAARPYALEA